MAHNQPNRTMIHATALRCFLYMCLLGGILGSCNTSSTDNENTSLNDSVIVESPFAADEINSNQSELLSTIIGSSDAGVIRGINFGDPISKVKSNETFEIFEDSTRHLGYTFETDQLETIDVLYYFTPNDRTVNKITVDVYLNSESATSQLWQSVNKRFSEKYGQPQESKQKQIIWKKAPVRATIIDVSEGKDFGLKFLFEPTDKTLLASRTL